MNIVFYNTAKLKEKIASTDRLKEEMKYDKKDLYMVYLKDKLKYFFMIITILLICLTCSYFMIPDLYPFPPENKNLEFRENLFKTVPLHPDDINSSFSNIEDLEWLRPIARENRVILLGESHYYQTIMHLRHRIFFAVNTFDYYHLLSLELQYSCSAFLEYYLHLEDEKTAAEFFARRIEPFTPSRELLELIRHIRSWNLTHPEKPLYLAAHDVEHDYKVTQRAILFPFIKKVDPAADFGKWNISETGEFDKYYEKIQKIIEEAEKQNIIGEYAFITPAYIRTVVENLKSKIYSMSNNRDNFYEYRQRAIVRNLTDPDYLGQYFLDGKVVLHGGGYHMAAGYPSTPGENYLREGKFLAYDFEPTKGKTYSLLMLGGALNMGSMAGISRDKYQRYGTRYDNIIDRFNIALVKNQVNPDDYYFLNSQDYRNIFFAYGARYAFNPYLIVKADWDQLVKEYPVMERQLEDMSGPKYKDFIQTGTGYSLVFDNLIVVPCSLIMQLRPLPGRE